MSNRFLGLFVLLVVTLGASPVQAQNQTEPKKPALQFNGNLRTRIEGWEWFRGDADNSYAFSGSLLRFSLGQQKKALDWQFELAAPILLGLPDNAVAPVAAQGQLGFGASYFIANDRSRNTALPFVKQAFIRIKGLGGKEAQSLRLGRMEFIDATEVTPKNATLAAVKRDRLAHRLIGNFGFTHVGRSFDGLQYTYNSPKNNVTLLAARPTRGVFQVDGWGELNIALSYGAYTRQISSGSSAGELRLFGIFYDDWRQDIVKTDSRALAARRADQGNIRIGTGGAHYIQALETQAGTVDFLLWGALQTGSWGLLNHRAGAVAAEAGIQPKAGGKLKPWFRTGFYFSSGDDNPNDGTHGTFFQILPTPRVYARFPFYNQMNNVDVFGEVVLRPSARCTVRGDVHAVRLANSNDLWYQGGGAFQPWTFGYTGRPSGGVQALATIADISAEYQINKKVSLGAYFANAWGSQVAESIYPKGKNARMGYLEVGYKF